MEGDSFTVEFVYYFVFGMFLSVFSQCVYYVWPICALVRPGYVFYYFECKFEPVEIVIF